MITVSPSCRNFLSPPSDRGTGFDPLQESSSMEPKEEGSGPEIVPDARRSPGFMLQPVIVWWASCCFIVQYMYLKLDCDTTLEVEEPAGLIATSRLTSKV